MDQNFSVSSVITPNFPNQSSDVVGHPTPEKSVSKTEWNGSSDSELPETSSPSVISDLSWSVPQQGTNSLSVEQSKESCTRHAVGKFSDLESPWAMAEELRRIECEEQIIGKPYEQQLEEVLEEKRRRTAELYWNALLNQWKKWTISEFFFFLMQIDNKCFGGYFSSADKLEAKWLEACGRKFKGEDLSKIDREDLAAMGITNKEHRKKLAVNIHELCKRGN
ncbi:hypothetical protein RFI_17299 [Reticulomyxa filosa]|uniref:SAM domain-containing protein n=1 Tax=Reticulomyxa filosa TaxID=46433 RepID=X6N2H5_RETFI|nr:hypothetical protein RFI_17299 [Reticulomyxa filosa]|eukprot:ETO19924.1 hypothetical protein RFI_17299 [Reticulomyxa filosa]